MGIWNIKTWYILYLSFVNILLPLCCWESEAFEQWGPEQLTSWTVRFNYLRVQGCFQRKNPPGGIVNQQLKKLTKTCKVKDHWLPFIVYNPVKDSLKISILLFKKTYYLFSLLGLWYNYIWWAGPWETRDCRI